MNKTTEALKLSREIILHLLENHPTARHHRKTREALSAIDAAMEEQETVECESCGKTILECDYFAITEGKPSENNMKFCHHCGKALVEHPYVEPEESE